MNIRDNLLAGPLGFGTAPLGNMFRNIPDEEAAARPARAISIPRRSMAPAWPKFASVRSLLSTSATNTC